MTNLTIGTFIIIPYYAMMSNQINSKRLNCWKMKLWGTWMKSPCSPRHDTAQISGPCTHIWQNLCTFLPQNDDERDQIIELLSDDLASVTKSFRQTRGASQELAWRGHFRNQIMTALKEATALWQARVMYDSIATQGTMYIALWESCGY